MSSALLAAVAMGIAFGAAARLLVPPTPRLAPRVRPYSVAARVALGADPGLDRVRAATSGIGTTGPLPVRVFAPMIGAAVKRVGHIVEGRSDEALTVALHQAGRRATTADDFRASQATRGALGAVGFGFVTALLGASLLFVVIFGAAGFVWGASRARAAIDAAIAARATALRLELYTVNQLLALHIRTGAGPIQAIQRVVDRGRGVIVEELGDIIAATRNGSRESDAFRRAAELTPEPAAARTYHLFATGAERGADLGGALRALSNDLRDARREQVRKDAVRRRAAMLVPTVAILAPIMLLFIAAPIPMIVFGSR